MEFSPLTFAALHVLAAARIVAPIFRRFALAGGVFALLSIAHAQSVRYREELAIEWGPVAFVTDGNTLTKESWFVRQAPTFAVGETFTLGQRRWLAEKFEACRGTVAGV